MIMYSNRVNLKNWGEGGFRPLSPPLFTPLLPRCTHSRCYNSWDPPVFRFTAESVCVFPCVCGDACICACNVKGWRGQSVWRVCVCMCGVCVCVWVLCVCVWCVCACVWYACMCDECGCMRASVWRVGKFACIRLRIHVYVCVCGTYAHVCVCGTCVHVCDVRMCVCDVWEGHVCSVMCVRTCARIWHYIILMLHVH